MKKLAFIISTFIFISFSSSAQDLQVHLPNKFILLAKGGVGTSWLTYPKVFLVDENDLTNVWSVSPATNGFTFYLGVQGIIPLGEHWAFLPEINYSFLSGEVNVNHIQTSRLARELQTYSRILVPLTFGIISLDKFGFGFGPVVYFTIADNKGLDKAVFELTDKANVNSDNPVGLAIRLAAVVETSKKIAINVKFDYDLGRYFEYNDGVYDVKMAMQSLTIGVGYLLTKE